MLKITWTAVINQEIMREVRRTRLSMNRIRKWQAAFFGLEMRREDLDGLITIDEKECEAERGLWDSLATRLNAEKLTLILSVTQDLGIVPVLFGKAPGGVDLY